MNFNREHIVGRFDSSGFQEVIGYKDWNYAPSVVADATYTNLNWYFGSTLGKQYAKEYFAGPTLSLLHNAKKGFLRNYQKIDRIGVITEEDAARLHALAKPFISHPDPEEDEAFGYSLVVFSMLPVMAESGYLPMGFSRRGVLEPPFTTREYHERLDELQREFMGIVSGTTDPNMPVETRTSLWRTYLFFQVAHNLPIHFEQSPRDVEQRTRHTIEHLLDDIKVNLD